MWRADLFEKTLMLGKIEGEKRRGWQRMRWLDDITDSVHMSLGKLQEKVMDRVTWRTVVHRTAKSWTWLSNWTELNWINSERIFLVYFLICYAWHIISVQQTLIKWIMLSQQRPFFFFFLMPHTLLQQIKRSVQETLWFIEENKDWQSLRYSLKSAALLSHSQLKGSQNVYRYKSWMLILFLE